MMQFFWMEEQGHELRSKKIRSVKEGDDPVEPSCTEVEPIILDLCLAELCPICSLHQEFCVSSSSSFFPRLIKLRFSVFLHKAFSKKYKLFFPLFLWKLSSLPMLHSMSFPHYHWNTCKDNKSKSILHYLKTLMQ